MLIAVSKALFDRALKLFCGKDGHERERGNSEVA